MQGGTVAPVACLPRVSSNDPAYILYLRRAVCPRQFSGLKKGFRIFSAGNVKRSESVRATVALS